MSIIEERIEFNLSESDISDSQRVNILSLSVVFTVMNRINLPEIGCFPFILTIEGADGDAAFEGIDGFGETFSSYFHFLLIFFERSVYGCRAYLRELFSLFGNIFHEAMRVLDIVVEFYYSEFKKSYERTSEEMRK